MQRVEPAQWQDAVRDAMASGHTRLVTLMGIDDDGVQVWLRLRNATGDDVVLGVPAEAGVGTLVGLLPDVAWCEREAAEMFGIVFHGHDTEPLLLPAGSPPVMRKDVYLEARSETPWPGEKEPGGAVARRRQRPAGVRP